MDPNNVNFNAILSSLDAIENSSSYSVYLPSQDSEIDFKALSTEQLKELLKTVIDTPIYNTQFVLTFNDIIKRNCLNTEIIDKITAYDKLFIFLKTRIENINSEYNINFSDDELKQYNIDTDTKASVSVTDIYNKLIKNKQTFSEQSFTQDQCTVTCSIPTLETENKLEKEFHKTTKLNVDTPEELREIVGNTFINEITKYIVSININDQMLNFAELTFKNRIKIVEKIPTIIIKNVLKYIETYKQYVLDTLKVKITVSNKEQKQVVIEKETPFDASFFNT